MTLYADPTDVADLAESMPMSYLQCRDFGHSWRPYSAAYHAGDRTYVRTQRCPRCKTFRDQELSERGTQLRSSYRYADGYLMEGLGRIVGDGRDALRLASITRSIAQFTSQSA